MYYLAQVIEKPLYGKTKVQLVSQKRLDGLWAKVASEAIALSSEQNRFNQGVLVLVELNEQRQIVKIIPALDELISSFRDWVLKSAKFDGRESEIKLWRESLDYQSQQLFIREQEIERREDLLKQREKKLQLIYQAVQQRANAIEREREALKGAWEHVHYASSRTD